MSFLKVPATEYLLVELDLPGLPRLGRDGVA